MIKINKNTKVKRSAQIANTLKVIEHGNKIKLKVLQSKVNAQCRWSQNISQPRLLHSMLTLLMLRLMMNKKVEV